jgi:transaldolase
MADSLKALSDLGVAVWLDDLSRTRLVSGSLAELARDCHVVGVTTNPTIFHRALSGSDAYNAQIQDLARRRVDVGEAVRMITTRDVRWACDVLRAAYDASDGVDGRVSIEVDPRLAHDTVATVAEARQLWWLVDRPNLFIKIPATDASLPAITTCLSEGISVNVTLIFSLPRYEAVMEAFLEGMQRAQVAGQDLSRVASVASLFVSRMDTEVDKRLDRLGTPEAALLRGQAAIANARLVFARHEALFAEPRWKVLADVGARPQRPLWASTGVKDPAYDDTRYVTQLATAGVVSTMPEATLRAVRDHGRVEGDTVHGRYREAGRILDSLTSVGVDYDDVVRTLEADAVTAFEASWHSMATALRDHIDSTGPGPLTGVSQLSPFDSPGGGTCWAPASTTRPIPPG